MNSTVSTGGWFSFSQMHLHIHPIWLRPGVIVTVTVTPSSHQLHEFVVLQVSQLCHRSRTSETTMASMFFIAVKKKTVCKSQAIL